MGKWFAYYNQGEGDILKFFRRSADTNTPFVDEANDQVTWQADGHVVTIDFDTVITASTVTIEYELIWLGLINLTIKL